MMLVLALVASQAATPDAAIGRWRTPELNAVIEITRCGPSICGRIVGSDLLKADPGLLDIQNKDPALRKRRVMNLQLLDGFTWKSGAWTGGRIYNARDGGTYDATVTPSGPNQLKLKGCIVWPLCKSQVWTRVG